MGSLPQGKRIIETNTNTENMKTHSFRSALENNLNIKQFNELFSADVIFYSPILSIPVTGIDKTTILIYHMINMAQSIQITEEFQSVDQHLLFWICRVNDQLLNAATILVDDENGLIKEVRMFMGPWATLSLFVYGLNLGEVIVEQYWSANKDWTGPVNYSLEYREVNLAPEVSLDIPFITKPVVGRYAVQGTLDLLYSVMNRSGLTSLVETRELQVDLFKAEIDDFTMEGLWITTCNEKGEITKLSILMNPWPMMTVLTNAAKKLARKNTEYSFLTPDYWELPIAAFNTK
jgi:hypothetical protein